MKNKTNFFFGVMTLLMVGAFAQSSYAADMEKEKKGDEDKKNVNLRKIVFIKKYTPENSEERTTEVFAITLDPSQHYYTQNPGSNEVCVGLTKDDFLGNTITFPFAKFFAREQDKAMIEDAESSAVRNYEAHMSRIQKRPGTFAALVGIASVAGTAALSMFFK